MSGRTSQLQIRVTPEEKAALKRLAGRAGQNVSTYVLSRALPPEDQDLNRLLGQLGQGLNPWEGVSELARLVSDLGPDGAGRALADVRLTGLSPLAQNLLAAVAEDLAQATGGPFPPWTLGVPLLPRPQFRWPLVSLRPDQIRRTRTALKRRNIFDPSVPSPIQTPPSHLPRELASLGDELRLLELELEFYFVGGAIFNQTFASPPLSARPYHALRPGDSSALAKLDVERTFATGPLADQARGVVSTGSPPGGFVDIPYLKIFAAPADYVLAVKVACARAEPSTRELDDFRFLLRVLNLTTVEAAMAAIARYVSSRHLPAQIHDTLQRVLNVQ